GAGGRAEVEGKQPDRGRGVVLGRPAARSDRGGRTGLPCDRGGPARPRARPSIRRAAPSAPPPGPHRRALVGATPAGGCGGTCASARHAGGSPEPPRLYRPAAVAGLLYGAVTRTQSGSPPGPAEGHVCSLNGETRPLGGFSPCLPAAWVLPIGRTG